MFEFFINPTEIPKNKIIRIKDSKDKITKLGLKKSSAKIIPKNSVLLTSRASIGYVAIAGTDVSTNQGFISLVCTEIVNNFFLAHWLFGNKGLLESKAAGTTFKEISKSKLKKLEFKLPPLNEQKRIVEKIEDLLSKLDNVKFLLLTIKQQLNQYKQALLLDAISGKLSNTEISKNSKFKIFKKPIPKNWNLIPLKEIGDWTGGGTPSKTQPKFWKNGTIPWVSPKDMTDLEINDSKDKITINGLKNSSAKLIKSNSILFVVRSGILKHTLPIALTSIDVTLNQDMKSVTPNESILPKYFFFSILALRKDIRNTCSKHGTTVQSIEIPKLMQYEIPIPPVNEQKEIILQLEQGFSLIEISENITNSMLLTLKIFRSSLIKHAFEGKLVPQDPNDEPASVLLKRIKSQN